MLKSIADDYLHGDLEEARNRAHSARTTFASAQRPDHAAYEMQFRLLEADILLRENRAKDVVTLLTCATGPIPNAPDLRIRHEWLCGLSHWRLNQAPLADEELRQSQALAESVGSPLLGEALRAQGIVARDRGQFEQSTLLFERSLAIARQAADPLLTLSDLIDLAINDDHRGHFDQVIQYDQTAADFARTVHAQRQLQIALGNMGWAYQNLGDFEHALGNFQDAQQLAKDVGMFRNRVLWLEDAGLAAYRLGNSEAAQRYDEEALKAAMALTPSVEDQVITIQTNLALLLYGKGQYEDAKHYADAAEVGASHSTDNNAVGYLELVQGLLAKRLGATGDAEHLLTAARDRASDLDLRTDIENALANLYGDTKRPAAADLWHRRAIQTFEAKRSAVRDESLRLGVFGYGDAAYRDYAEFLVGHDQEAKALNLLDRSRARTLEDGLGMALAAGNGAQQDAIDAQALARRLDATLLFYSLGRERSYLWAINAHQRRVFELPAAKDIEAQIQLHQKAIRKSEDLLKGASPEDAALFSTLVGPAASMMADGSRVFVIPDGALHTLNFETLLVPTPNGARYWIEHVTVTTASSIAMLSRWQSSPVHATDRNLLLIGDPLTAPGEFESLPHAGQEVTDVRRHFAPASATVLTQVEAQPSAYAASRPEQYQYIHFVAHGTASRLNPLESAVVLSPPAHAPEGFKLYGRDIVRQPLNATLVTISACYGSGARTYAGEGLVGLAWAFLRAGSHNVIGTLWQADDAATPPLMDQMYAELAAGKSPAVALRDAKLLLLHSQNVYRKPFYWGAFQLYAGS